MFELQEHQSTSLHQDPSEWSFADHVCSLSTTGRRSDEIATSDRLYRSSLSGWTAIPSAAPPPLAGPSFGGELGGSRFTVVLDRRAPGIHYALAAAFLRGSSNFSGTLSEPRPIPTSISGFVTPWKSLPPVTSSSSRLAVSRYCAVCSGLCVL